MADNKQNKRPNVPPLRFPEFTEPWERKKLSNFTERVTRKNKGQTNLPLTISAQYGLVDQISFFNNKVASADMSNYYLLKRGEFTYNKSYSSDYPLGAVKRLDLYDMGALSTLYICFKIAGDINSDYLVHYFESPKWHRGVYEIAGEGARNHGLLNIAVGDYFETQHYLPCSLKEQEKIASMLNLIQRRIEVQNKLIEQLESLIKGITLQASKSSDCESVLLSNILTERNEANTAQHEVCSVSVSQGVVNQVEYLGRSFAAKDISHYNVVHYGDIIYTKSPTGDFPYGIVKRSHQQNHVAVSPLYGVYIPTSNDIGCFLHYYFCNAVSAKNYLHKLIQKGAKNTINITNQRFLENTINLPKAEKLAQVVALLNCLSAKKEQAENLLALLNKQKQFFLNQMFI